MDELYLFENSVPVDMSLPHDENETVDLAGFQVTRAEFFSHAREPAITIWDNRIKFNMACLRRFPGASHIQVLIHPDQKRLIIRPCNPDAPDSLRWCKGGGEKEMKTRELLCRIFAGKVFDLMEWDAQYKYRILGKPATCDNEVLFLFKLADFELFLSGRKPKSYFPVDWKGSFGLPQERHEEEYRVDLADGYITTGQGARR